ncbi:winged helix-turn-helix domain-containing protein [Mucilaginibacter pedocola]|uniref:OmpR/PhoB-type domain-containing protein n=1 Tax=Mucilaginibacter pedocola TaxID=1792845 RepID=A0A1S9P6H0_9SPHI|nr:winged helix-turn-helix domain-containing protein [Mucilaginibacter pedocola]OOQ56541.1 hypothetical protein BC343_19070 [Mucilaginibacter pedocola]
MALLPKLSQPKTKFVLGITLLLYSAMACVAFSLKGGDSFGEARQQIALRKVGHEVLRYLGDSSSSVLPVIKTDDNAYQLKFAHAFTFKTDSLVKITERTLADAGLTNRHVVNVRRSGAQDVVFAYIIEDKKADGDKALIPCSGRTQPLGNYVVEINFEKDGISSAQQGYLLGGIPLLALIGLLFSRPAKQQVVAISATDKQREEQLTIGNTIFDAGKRTLKFEGNITELTFKENRVLLILAASPNEIVERARLQKEVWEDEGVIVGRSLDVFVSKLRKKLEADEAIQLINIRGKGYTLEVKA